MVIVLVHVHRISTQLKYKKTTKRNRILTKKPEKRITKREKGKSVKKIYGKQKRFNKILFAANSVEIYLIHSFIIPRSSVHIYVYVYILHRSLSVRHNLQSYHYF